MTKGKQPEVNGQPTQDPKSQAKQLLCYNPTPDTQHIPQKRCDQKGYVLELTQRDARAKVGSLA